MSTHINIYKQIHIYTCPSACQSVSASVCFYSLCSLYSVILSLSLSLSLCTYVSLSQDVCVCVCVCVFVCLFVCLFLSLMFILQCHIVSPSLCTYVSHAQAVCVCVCVCVWKDKIGFKWHTCLDNYCILSSCPLNACKVVFASYSSLII